MLERIGPWRLSGMALPLAVWAAHFLAVYIMQGLACWQGWQRQRVAGMEMVSWWLLLATVVALALIAWQGMRALRCRRLAKFEVQAAKGVESPVAMAARRRHFMSVLTALVSVVAFIAVCFTALPVLLLPPCA
ncbi:hypothetical protein BGP89_06120 [Luteimonas sp. JM171]|uniref:hypothetical protein n=1 Tax=Luteimonas sp. JM171 TaxID=1896164 RepID=UPI000858BF4E|nr:hypothetical protein [Luteimonas sp. JM171]AOH35985.1 hypothetical protein BGP89_06120 [Luteimonas sp. JM171]